MYHVVRKSLGGGILRYFFLLFVKTIDTATRTYPENAIAGFMDAVDGLVMDGRRCRDDWAIRQFTSLFSIYGQSFLSAQP